MPTGRAAPSTGSAGSTSSVARAADDVLIEVVVPGAIPSASDPPGRQPNPLLDPRARPPAFDDGLETASACAAQSIVDLGDDGAGTALVERSAYQATMALGRDTAQARHEWKFERDRAEAQWKVVGGARGTAAAQRRSTLPVRPANPFLPPGFNATGPDFGKLQRDVQHNLAVLDARHQALTQAEQRYAEELAAFLARAWSGLSRTPASALALTRLAAFEQFRQRQVRRCIDARGKPTARSRETVAATDADVERYATEVIAARRADLLAAIASAPGSTSLQETFVERLGSVSMLDVALRDPAIGRAYRARHDLLAAHEQREREARAREHEETWGGTVPRHVPVTVARPHRWSHLPSSRQWRAVAGPAIDPKRPNPPVSFDEPFDRIVQTSSIDGRLEVVEAACAGHDIGGVRLRFYTSETIGDPRTYGTAIVLGHAKYGAVSPGRGSRDPESWSFADVYGRAEGSVDVFVIRPDHKDRLMASWSLAGDVLKAIEQLRAGMSGDPAHYYPTIDAREVIRSGGIRIVLFPQRRTPIPFTFGGPVAQAFTNMCAGRGSRLDVREAAIQEDLALIELLRSVVKDQQQSTPRRR